MTHALNMCQNSNCVKNKYNIRKEAYMNILNKITGIHSIDIKVEAKGHGCVNWNGPTELTGNDGKTVKNHSLPKLRGFSNKTGKVKEENGYEYKVNVNDISLKDTPMYVSENCFKHHIFKREMPYHLGKLEEKHVANFLLSPAGFLRGYAITSQVPIMKTSPMLVEDLVEIDGISNYENLTTASSKEGSETGGLYTKTTVGDTRYIGYLSINIEELQFVSCDGLFGRSAVGLSFTQDELVDLASRMTLMLNDLKTNEELDPHVEFSACWVKKGSLAEVGEAGFLLNEDAQQIYIDWALERLGSLCIKQAGGWLAVQNVVADYNSGKHFRIKDDFNNARQQKSESFAIYYRQANKQEISNSQKATEKSLSNGAKRRNKKLGKKAAKANSDDSQAALTE